MCEEKGNAVEHEDSFVDADVSGTEVAKFAWTSADEAKLRLLHGEFKGQPDLYKQMAMAMYRKHKIVRGVIVCRCQSNFRRLYPGPKFQSIGM